MNIFLFVRMYDMDDYDEGGEWRDDTKAETKPFKKVEDAMIYALHEFDVKTTEWVKGMGAEIWYGGYRYLRGEIEIREQGVL